MGSDDPRRSSMLGETPKVNPIPSGPSEYRVNPHHEATRVTDEGNLDRVSETNQITDCAIRAALQAGAIALAGFRSAGLVTDTKADQHDVVTRYDRECEAHIRRVILDAFPDSSIVGEEEAALVGPGPLTWFVDPIDGTSNFARGIAMWAVSIGVAYEGELIGGVIFDPVSAQLFWADERGAFLRSREFGGEDQPLGSTGGSHGAGNVESAGSGGSASSAGSRGSADPARATVALNFPLARDLVHFPELALEQFAQVTREFAQVRGLGSTCIALCWIAAGWLDVTVSFDTNPWDVAAGAFIIRKAGGVFHGYRDGLIVAESHSHLAPHYYAAVSSGEFDLLHEIMRSQSMRPNEAE